MPVYNNNPRLAGEGTAVIVDALPAEGVEGTTYLLRKTTEIPGKQAMHFDRVYVKLTSGGHISRILVSDEVTLPQFFQYYTGKLNMDESTLPDWIAVNFEEVFAGTAIMTTAEEETYFNDSSIAFIETEAELADIDFDVVTTLYQKLEDIKLDDFWNLQTSLFETGKICEIRCTLPNSLISKYEISNNKILKNTRELKFDITTQKYLPEFTEWVNTEDYDYEGTLTNTYSTDEAHFQFLVDEEIYAGYVLAISDPDEPSTYTYSYTEYVFDQGVYTEVSTASEPTPSENTVTVGDNFLLGASFVAEKLMTLSATGIDGSGEISAFGNFKFDVYNFMTKHMKHDTDQLNIMFSTTLSSPYSLELTVKLENDGNDNVLAITINDVYYGTERFNQTYPLSGTVENLLQVMETFEFTDKELEVLYNAIYESIDYFSETGPNEGMRNIMFITRDGSASSLLGYGGVINLTINDVFCDLFRLNKVESNYDELDQFINN